MLKYKYSKLHQFFRNFEWMRVYFSPFKFFLPKLYVGKIAIAIPYFLPRRWVEDKEKDGYLKAVPIKFGFSSCGLGWKTKWTSTDFRHEWNPVWSFVFFGYQIALIFIPENDTQYWESYLAYHRDTDKSKSTRERLSDCIKNHPCTYISYKNGVETKTDYWKLIVKEIYINTK